MNTTYNKQSLVHASSGICTSQQCSFTMLHYAPLRSPMLPWIALALAICTQVLLATDCVGCRLVLRELLVGAGLSFVYSMSWLRLHVPTSELCVQVQTPPALSVCPANWLSAPNTISVPTLSFTRTFWRHHKLSVFHQYYLSALLSVM